MILSCINHSIAKNLLGYLLARVFIINQNIGSLAKNIFFNGLLVKG
jgi:hypothetical protein